MKKLISLLLLVAVFTGCRRDDQYELLRSMIQENRSSEISECTYQGQTYYKQTSNYYDSITYVYNTNGDLVAECNYAWGDVDDLCDLIYSCKVVYRCDNHISGEPAVNVYDL
jgi:hypothetical protein